MSEFKNGDKVNLFGGTRCKFVGPCPYNTLNCVLMTESGDLIVRSESHVTKAREPIRVEGWVNIYESEPSAYYSLYGAKVDADKHAALMRCKRIACVKVTGTEEL